jgi:PAS domain S-box-containing protein
MMAKITGNIYMTLRRKYLLDGMFQSEKMFVWIYCAFSVGIICAGWRYYSHYKSKLKDEVATQITAVGKLKADELGHWRQERLGDGKVFFRNAIFAGVVINYFNEPDSRVFKDEIAAWLNSVQTAYEYDKIFLFDDKFQTRIAIPEDMNSDSFLICTPRIKQSQQIEFEDFYWNQNKQKLFLRIVVPIFKQNSIAQIGKIVLRIDPQKYIYPNIQNWPVSNIDTAETILVRLNGNSVEYLNELRFYHPKAVMLKRSVTDINIPAVRVALGYEGVMEGVDYRGVGVLAYGQAIYNSPWYIITKIDQSEIYASFHKGLLVIIFFVGVLLVGGGAGIGFARKKRTANFYRQKYNEAKEWSTTFDSVSDPVAIIDKNCRLKLVNKKFTDLLGKKPEEIVGTHCYKMIHNSENCPDNCPLQKTLSSGKPAQIEMNALDANLEVSTYPIFNSDGEVVEAVHFMRDITEQKKAEATLCASENRFKGMFENSAAGMAIVAADLHFVDVNKAFCQMLGYSREQILKMTVKDITHSEDWDVTSKAIQKLGKDETEIFNLEKRYLHSSGAIVWGLVCVTSVKDAGGNLLQLAQVYDITKRKIAEQNLYENQKKLELALKSAHMGVSSFDIVNNKRYYDNQACYILGIDPAKYAGEPDIFFKVLHPDDREKVKSALKKTIEADVLYEPEYRVIRPDGSIHYIAARGSLIRDAAKRPLKINGIIWDVTENKRLEQRQIFLSKMLILVNQNKDLIHTIREVNSLIKEFTGFEAVGIRLREGNDYPYYASEGFPEQFLEKERYLCARDKNGEIICDANKIPFLECMCGNIICGRTDPKFPFFTKGGSFWTNSTTDLLASTSDEERKARTRNFCNKQGYECVGLIPLHIGKENVGLIQLNDHRKDLFTLDMIEFFEIAGKYIGTTFARKQAEEAIQQSEQKFSALYSSMTEGVALHEILYNSTGKPIDYRIIDVNHAFESILGISKENAIGQKASELYGLNSPPYLDIYTKVISSGKPELFETYFEPMKKYFNISVFSPAKGKFATVFEDITERRKVEQEIIKQRDISQSYLDTVEAMIVALDKDGNITTVNRKGCQILGRNENELIGKNWFLECLPQPQGVELVYKVFLKLMSGAMLNLEYYENPIITSTGEIREIAWHNAVLKDKQGQITGILSAGLDITQEKKAQQQILIERNNLKAIFESSPVGMLLLDEDMNVIDANEVIASMMLKEPSKLIGQRGGRSLGCINSLENDKGCGFGRACPNCSLGNGITQVLQTGTSIHGAEIQLTLLINNQPRDVWLNISAETLTLNNRKHIIVAVDNITNRKRIEEDLIEANYNLKIANDMAKDAATGAAIAEEYQRQRIAMMLHDNIGQDMVFATMRLDAIEKTMLAGHQKSMEINEIKKTLDRTIESVRTLSFDLSSPILHKFGFATAIYSWIKERFQGNKNTEIKFVNNAKEGKLDKDTNIILYQVIHELLINIVKHADAKNVEVRIEQANGKIEVEVADDGKGFELSRIGKFDPKKGGFGLNNIRDRITYLGGNFKIESKPGNGTQIVISIPEKITN